MKKITHDRIEKIGEFKVVLILMILSGITITCFSKSYFMVGVLMIFIGLKLINKKFVKRFSSINNSFKSNPDRRIRWMKFLTLFVASLPIIFMAYFEQPLYRFFLISGSMAPLLLYNLIDRYSMIANAGNYLKISEYFEGKRKGTKFLLWAALITFFIPHLYYVAFGLLLVGVIRFFTLKALYSPTNNFVYMQPAKVYYKSNTLIKQKLGVNK